ncbi:hypothetical protein [Euzebya sp.]|uniref:hypothetical protein n=1 Tax=Euzebya sp. TaxID=1971409 RepID=UPI00351785AC
MCGRTVTVDAEGRCALGHQAIPPDEAAARRRHREERRGRGAAGGEAEGRYPQGSDAEEADVIASWTEPRIGFSTRAAPPPLAPAEALPVMDPVPEVPADGTTPPADADPLPLRIPERLRRPLDAPSAVGPIASALDAGIEDAHPQPAAVAVADLTPSAVSVLDVAIPRPGRHEPTPTVDVATDPTPARSEVPDVEPPRSWTIRLAATAFVAVLLAVAWYLATAI